MVEKILQDMAVMAHGTNLRAYLACKARGPQRGGTVVPADLDERSRRLYPNRQSGHL